MDDEPRVDLHDIGDPNWRPSIGRALKLAASFKSEFNKSDNAKLREYNATKTLTWLIQAMALAAGDDLLSAYYGEPADNRHEGLLRLWYRLSVPAELFKHQETDAPDTFAALRTEILALAHGDKPALLARLDEVRTPKQPESAYKVVTAKLEILVWDRFVKEHCTLSLPLNRFRSWVATGFDSSAKSDWMKEAEKYLGRENVELALSFAANRVALLPNNYTDSDVEAAVKLSVAKLRQAER